ncbi:MAG: TldD/PmbA family protein [Methanocalculaceae archaeon]|jgi:TldD protein|nr:TldD/PmbA family protein [Methanocalculaceae archaeon]
MDPIRYYDIRYVSGTSTAITVENGNVESAGSNFFGKALIRVLGDRGWGCYCASPFDPEDRTAKQEYISRAARAAKLANVPAEIADVPYGNPRSWSCSAAEQAAIPIEEKADLLLRMESGAKTPDICSTSAQYSELYQDVWFEDCNDYNAASSICRTLFTICAVAARSGNMQMNYEQEAVVGPLNLSGYLGYGEKCARRAAELLDASAISGGRMPVVLDPAIGGVFAHEAVGHASEGDAVRDGISVLAGKLGMRVGSPQVTIIDDPSMHGYGYEPFDAECIACGPIELVKGGIMNAYIHSRETLATVGTETGDAGHARAESGMQPLVRMSNTYIKEGDAEYDEIIAECRNGVLLIGSRGGEVDPGRGAFVFNAKYGYRIENGETTAMIRDVSLSGDILSVLHNTTLCGNERKMSGGVCGKGGQLVPVGDGAPHVYLTEAMVGGCGNA